MSYYRQGLALHSPILPSALSSRLADIKEGGSDFLRGSKHFYVGAIDPTERKLWITTIVIDVLHVILMLGGLLLASRGMGVVF